MESPSFSVCKPDETVEWATIYHWTEVISDEPGMRTLSQCQPISKTEKNTWQFASLLVQATFRGSIFPNCWFSVIPMLLLVFLLVQLLYLAPFHALFILIHLWLSPLWIPLPERRDFFSSGLSMYQCFAQRMWFLPPPLPHIQVLAPSFDLRFVSFHLHLYVPIVLCKRK